MWAAESQESLVQQIKDLQRSDPSAKEQWSAFCAANGSKRDPAMHDVSVLQAFLEQLSSGTVLSTRVVSGDAATLEGAIKLMQKKSPNFKQAWSSYCAQHGGGKNDPAKHDANFHVQFFDVVTEVFLGAGGGWGGGAGWAGGGEAWAGGWGGGMMGGGNPLKRMRDASGKGVPTSIYGSGGGMKDALVQQVKAFQRSGEEQKEIWWQYADTHLGGVRDPSRHDAGTLQEFCQNHQVPSAGSNGAGGGAGKGGGGMGAADPGKSALVERIKSFQRASPDSKELWWNYADTYLGGNRDPNRHLAHELKEFCDNHGLPGAGGGGMRAGAGSAAKSMGGGGAGAMDPEKADLVERIKNYQRAGHENKETWGAFARGVRDPSRHDVERLHEFCSTYGI